MSFDGVNMDPMLEISRGVFPNIKYRNLKGRNPDVDTGTVPEDLWDGNTALYVPPTFAQPLDITGGAQDTGVKVNVTSGGTVTTASLTQIIDTAADFVTDAIVQGDIVLNDTTQDHSYVISVDSANVLTVIRMHHGDVNEIGDVYRIVRATGTGAAVAHIKEGLDVNLDIQKEFVILNGAAIVSTVNDYSRLNIAHTHGVGSGGANAGNIEFTAQTDGTLTGRITAGLGEMAQLFYTVPRGYDGWITGLESTLFKTGAASDALAQVTLHEKLWKGLGYDDGDLLRGSWGVSVHSNIVRTYRPYLYISEFSDVWMRAEDVSDSNSIITGEVDIILTAK